MKNQFLLWALACLLLAQCAQPDPAEMPGPASVTDPAVESFALTSEEAAAEALDAREAIAPTTRSKAVAVRSVMRHNAAQAAAQCSIDPSLYVVNFADDGGFAIVAADRRQPATVYAVSDEGAFPDPETLGDGALKYLYSRIATLAATPQDNEKSTVYLPGPWTDLDRADRLIRLRWGTGAPFYGSAHSTAICQIMSFHQWPAKYDWKTINSLVCALDLHLFDPARDAKIKALFEEVNKTMQGTELNENFGTFGYVCNTSEPYTVQKVISEVDAKRPVYAQGRFRRGCLVFGYLWIMDGYLLQKRTLYPVIPKPKPGDDLQPTDPGTLQPITPGVQKVELRNLIHCNLGNDGKGNGYYLSTLFDLAAGAVIPDDDALPKGDPVTGQVDYDASTVSITTGIRPFRFVTDPDQPVIVGPGKPIDPLKPLN